MNQNDLWLLFMRTGKIEYYLKYKNYKEDGESMIEHEQEDRGYCN